MNEKMKIPGKLSGMLNSRYSLKEEDFIMAAVADLDEEFRFAETFVMLANDGRLVLATYPYVPQRKFSFGGYERNAQESYEEQDPIIRIVMPDECEELFVLRNISGGTLIAKMKDGGKTYDKALANFTNSRMGALSRMGRVYRKLQKSEEITTEDIEGNKKLEYCPKCGSLYPDQERKVCPKCVDRKSILFRVAKYFKPYTVRIVIICFCIAGTAVLNLVAPYLSGTVLYDKVLSKDPEFMARFGGGGGRFVLVLTMVVLTMLFTQISIKVLGIIQGRLTAKTVPLVLASLKDEIFRSMGKLSISFFNNRATGGLMARVSDDADEVTGFFIDGVPYFFVSALTMLATIIIMFRLNVWMAIVSIVLLPWLTYTAYRMLPKMWNAYGKRHRANRRLKSRVNDNLTGARVVKAFGQESSEMGRFEKSNSGVKKAEMGIAAYDNKFYILFSATERFISFMIWGLGSALILTGADSNMELGLLMTFTGYAAQLNGPLDFFSHLFRWYTNCMNCAQRLFEIIDAVPEVREAADPIHPEMIRGEIELKNVTFGYEPNKPILKDVSFRVEAGQVLGIVGKSGAGKTTLVNLISRLYDTNEGEVYLDGENVKNLAFKELRKSIGIVSQETYIFMGTVAENIAYAKPDATREEIIRAAMQASAHDFICKMPEGYDTMLGSSGKSLSGGERQRISIARAILADPRILILDEATSAVDTETELAIQESLEKLVKGRTTLSIAHRLSTLRNADKLIVIEEGRLIESGTHEELLAKKGTFYRLAKLQEKALAMRGIE